MVEVPQAQGAMAQQSYPLPRPNEKEARRLLAAARDPGTLYTHDARLTLKRLADSLDISKTFKQQDATLIEDIRKQVLDVQGDIKAYFVDGWIIDTHIKDVLRHKVDYAKLQMKNQSGQGIDNSTQPPAGLDPPGATAVDRVSATRKPSSGCARPQRAERAGPPYKTPVRARSASELFTHKPLDARRKKIASEGDVPSDVSMPATGNILEGQRYSSPEAFDDVGTSSVALDAGYAATQPDANFVVPVWPQYTFGPLDDGADSQACSMGETSSAPEALLTYEPSDVTIHATSNDMGGVRFLSPEAFDEFADSFMAAYAVIPPDELYIDSLGPIGGVENQPYEMREESQPPSTTPNFENDFTLLGPGDVRYTEDSGMRTVCDQDLGTDLVPYPSMSASGLSKGVGPAYGCSRSDGQSIGKHLEGLRH